VTLYHLVLESTLGLTTFKFITDYLIANELLPGFVDGYSKIHRDETRHIVYGVWYLRETIREHPQMGDTVRQTLRDLLPSVAESLKPRATAPPSSCLAFRSIPAPVRARWPHTPADIHRSSDQQL